LVWRWCGRALFLGTGPDECFAFALRTKPDEGFQKLVWIASSLRCRSQ
jgi:hypothetical protein